ncbi:MAG: PepSY domain-containing protein [Chloroflexi bacterium]|nr:PepSY domain-containing protein [Chloroflexota bacterium]
MFAIKRLMLIALALAALAFGAFAVAQDDDTPVQLLGAISEMTVDTITVNGVLVDVSGAQLNTALTVGAVVRVEGWLSGSTVIAWEVNGVDDDVWQPGEVELVGTLTSYTGTTMVVGGQSIDVSAAQIGAGVVVGARVKVHATLVNGAWVAREVEVFAMQGNADDDTPGDDGMMDDDEFELVGTLEQIGTQTIVVSGQTISLVGAEVEDPLLVGVLVKVHLTLVDGVLTAREVELADRQMGVDTIIIGAVTEMDDDSVTINGVVIIMSPRELQGVQVGVVLRIEAHTRADGTVMAVHVEFEGDDDNNDDSGNDNALGTPSISGQRAIEIALAVYPNATVLRLELKIEFGGILVWQVRLSNRIEMNIDATSGNILTIDRPGQDDDDNGGSSSDNGSDNSSDNGGSSSDNGGSSSDDSGSSNNNNNDDHGNDNDDDDNDDDDGGMGG